MGTTSSQPLPSQTEVDVQTPDYSQDLLTQLDGAAMDDPAGRDDDVIHVRKSTDATRPLKRSRKERESNALESEQPEIADSQEATSKMQQQNATEESTQKPRKKKSKKEHALRDEGEGEAHGILATQSSTILEQTPQSTANTADASKRVKKRKRHTGRPSGLNILPAGMSDPGTQEESAIVGADRSTVMESPAQPTAVTQPKPKKSKDSKRLPGHPSPEMSQPVPKAAKSPKVKNARASGTSPAIGKSPKASSKRTVEVQEDSEMLPTPPEASQASLPRKGKVSKQATKEQNVDDGALRDDYSEVDATKQVEGWLSSQLDDQHPQSTPRVNSSGSKRSKKAAVDASAKREKVQRSEDREASKKRRRASQYLENDNEDYAPEAKEHRDAVVVETPGNTIRRKKLRANDETDGVADVFPTQETASPLVNKKARRLTEKTKTSAKKGVSVREKQDSGPATTVEGSTKKNRKPNTTYDENEGQEEYENVSAESTSAVGKVASSQKRAQNAERSKKGPLTAAEKRLVDNVFQETIDETGVSDAELRSLIQKWKTAVEFKEAVETALPDRPLAVIRKFCQRRFHNMERGPWSAESDAILRNSYATHPDKWTQISAFVGRTAADCKDRWNNIVSIQDTMQSGPWSQEETVALGKAVDQSIKELKKANKEAKDQTRAELEGMLSWSEVAKKLGGTRSAKRCHEKWQNLKRGEKGGRASTSEQPLSTGLDPATSSKKLRVIEKLYNQCDIGDLYDILTEIHTALPDRNQHFDHESTLWAVVAIKNPGSRFKSAMRRRGLYDAAHVYAAEVDDHPTISATAKALADHLEDQWGAEVLAEKRSFDPAAKSSKFKSAERVDSDDDDDEPGSDAEVVKGDTETPATSDGDDNDVKGFAVDNDDQFSEVVVPDSQPHHANNKHSGEDFAFSFKPINKKREGPVSPQADADSDVVEQLPASVKRKKSSKKAKTKAKA